MVLPGFGSARIPTNIRLILAVAVSMAILPVLWDVIYPRASAPGPTYVGLIFSETLIGVVYGLIARLYTLGMQYAGAVLSMSRSEEHTSELQSLMRISYAVFCLKKKKQPHE